MDSRDRQPISFVVVAYNQEAFIRQAVEGAFAQTGQPLEILLSDDCSPDGTFRIMQEMAAAYDGPHEVVLNRNPENLGLIGHVNRIMELTSGALVIISAGDDVSVPERAARVTEAFRAGRGEVHLVHSLAQEITEDGDPGVIIHPPYKAAGVSRPSPSEFLHWSYGHLGCTAAWSRILFERFGPIPEIAMVEDVPIFCRAALLGKVSFVQDPLVLYRRNGTSKITTPDWGRAYLHGLHSKAFKWRLSSARTLLHDLERCEFPGKAACAAACKARIRTYERKIAYSGMRPLQRLLALPKALADSIREKSAEPSMEWLRYTFEPITVALLNRRGFGILSAVKRRLRRPPAGAAPRSGG